MTEPATGAVAVSWDGPWLVVGLGNPGPRYAGNRHNVGQLVLDRLGEQAGARWQRNARSRAMVAETRFGPAPGRRVVLAKPSSYMNESGGPVTAVAGYFGIDPAGLVVVHDELDVPFGTIRLKFGGGEGGHNGLRSISGSLKTRDYYRVRVGVDRPPDRVDAADYVLSGFSAVERKQLPVVLADAADAVEDLVTRGLTAAQQRWHAPR